MSRALAIETSGRIGSIAIVENAKVLFEEQFAHGLQHAAQIIPIIDQLCRKHGWKPGDVEELHVSAGPGSFTGLRIGITLAKTMALATGVKLVAVPSVRVLVENAPAEARQVIIVLDAKREQIFTARFERAPGGEQAEWIEREPAHLDDLRSMLSRSGRPVHLLGEGIPYHEQFIPKQDAGIIVTSEDSWRARASSVAKIGLEMSARSEFADPLMLTPIYIRRPEAEEKMEIAEQKKK
ncbi:MAG TPA: tRNA (adenosine(37)-N6)-threonylcarbamoyltransferase complex dimerization subunit type 1 TsaB [Tepidisphaeraceae bacterium]|nr:tRNA (adenosine(37)-N6)-threonylcarbamoyltransferase complex dimerization subunit type 1 TsaB [Tepidisphaeraceae bacterium]